MHLSMGTGCSERKLCLKLPLRKALGHLNSNIAVTVWKTPATIMHRQKKGPYGVIILLNEVALRREKKLWLELNITP